MSAKRIRRFSLITLAVTAALWSASAVWPKSSLPVAAPILVTSAYRSVVDEVRRNETLSHLLGRHYIYGPEMLEFLSAAQGLNPRRVRPGQTFEFRYPVGDTVPDRVKVRVDSDRLLFVNRGADSGWLAEVEEVIWDIDNQILVAEIDNSLYLTIQDLIPDSVLPPEEKARLVWNVAEDVFGWEVDFTRDVYPGDRIKLLYQRLRSSLGEIRYGRLVAAMVETRGQPNLAYLLEDDRGRNAYYDERGRSLRRAFLRYPVQFRRISSSFTRRRFHPILKRSQPHLGVDYAASPGAPIRATADGVVKRAGRDRGYGVVVAIRHPKDIETRYAHMSRVARGIRPGVRVRQDQTIGYVGRTGLATGYHVHYEFLKNGRHVNPRNVDLGDGEPVPQPQRDEFFSLVRSYSEVLDLPVTPSAVTTASQ